MSKTAVITSTALAHYYESYPIDGLYHNIELIGSANKTLSSLPMTDGEIMEKLVGLCSRLNSVVKPLLSLLSDIEADMCELQEIDYSEYDSVIKVFERIEDLIDHVQESFEYVESIKPKKKNDMNNFIYKNTASAVKNIQHQYQIIRENVITHLFSVVPETQVLENLA